MNYYEILEVSSNASPEVIKNAYRALSKKYHPDRYKGDKSFAEEKLKEINLAYETLIDDEKRLQYDYDNGFKIDPNVHIVEENEIKEKEEDKEEKKEIKKDKSTWVIKKKSALISIVVVIAFILAFVIGVKLANTGEEKKEDNNIQTTTNTDTNKKKDTDTNYNYNNSNTKTDNKKEEENIQKQNVDKKEDENVDNNKENDIENETEETEKPSDYGDS